MTSYSIPSLRFRFVRISITYKKYFFLSCQYSFSPFLYFFSTHPLFLSISPLSFLTPLASILHTPLFLASLSLFSQSLRPNPFYSTLQTFSIKIYMHFFTFFEFFIKVFSKITVFQYKVGTFLASTFYTNLLTLK